MQKEVSRDTELHLWNRLSCNTILPDKAEIYIAGLVDTEGSVVTECSVDNTWAEDNSTCIYYNYYFW